MKSRGSHEGCIEQIDRLFRSALYSKHPVLDDEGRLRVDEKELDSEVQREVSTIWENISTENLHELSDFIGYRREFMQLFGFEVDGVDYEADINPRVSIPGLEI